MCVWPPVCSVGLNGLLSCHMEQAGGRLARDYGAFEQLKCELRKLDNLRFFNGELTFVPFNDLLCSVSEIVLLAF